MFDWLKRFRRTERPIHPKYGEPMTDEQIARHTFYRRLYQ